MKYTGLKVSNSALLEDDDKVYVERQRAGYLEKILVKVLRQNDTFQRIYNSMLNHAIIHYISIHRIMQ